MALFNEHLLSLLLFFPLLWGLAGTFLNPDLYKKHALVGSLFQFCFSLLLFSKFNGDTSHYQLMEKATWIPELGISYSLGVDGLSFWLILLTTFIMPICILASFSSIKERVKLYYFFLLMLQTGMVGAFVSLDAFLFYVFWEAMLIPMYFLVGIWGGKERIYASNKFFIYTVFGSLLMLVSIFYLAYQFKMQSGGQMSLALQDLMQVRLSGHGFWSAQSLMFLAFSLAFAIKVPMFPFHTWLPDAHVQAPTAGSVILAAVLLKMGGYGFIRFAMPLFPQAVAMYQGLFLALGSIAIIYGAMVAWRQTDIKKMIAYSSVSHMGYVVIGLFSLNEIGVSGAIFQMLCHGITTAGLFLMIGIIYERTHTRELSDYGGIAKVVPLYTVVFMIFTFASVALPGTNGFIGEFLILLGAWQAHPGWAVVACLGVIFGAVYMLWLAEKMLYGKKQNKKSLEHLTDLNLREIFVVVPLLFFVFFMGFQPNFFFSKMDASVQALLKSVQNKQIAMVRE